MLFVIILEREIAYLEIMRARGKMEERERERDSEKEREKERDKERDHKSVKFRRH